MGHHPGEYRKQRSQQQKQCDRLPQRSVARQANLIRAGGERHTEGYKRENKQRRAQNVKITRHILDSMLSASAGRMPYRSPIRPCTDWVNFRRIVTQAVFEDCLQPLKNCSTTAMSFVTR